jgi:hypothetical protein
MGYWVQATPAAFDFLQLNRLSECPRLSNNDTVNSAGSRDLLR